MKRLYLLLAELTVLAFAFAPMAPAQTTSYVAQGGQIPADPYDTWAKAASNIQDAISVATVAGSTVLVSNGLYQTGGVTNWPSGTVLTNRVAITNAITVKSANNSPTNTIIKGAGPMGAAAVRCVYMGNNSTLIGFTLTNGATLSYIDPATDNQRGAGAWSLSQSATISNCIMTGNSASRDGGGAYFYGKIFNCTVVGNSAFTGGGICYYCTVSNSTIVGNYASMEGGGVHACLLYNCMIASNSVVYYGGGGAYNQMYNCTIISNSVTRAEVGFGVGGGAVYCHLYECTVASNYARGNGGGLWAVRNARNCLIIGNSSMGNGGGVYFGGLGADSGFLTNCTIVGNSAATNAGGIGGGTFILNNSIVYFNTAGVADSNWIGAVSFTNSCTTTAAVGWASGNITSDPMFVNKGSGYGTTHVAGNYRLAGNSPCINAGTNGSWMTNGVDLDGRMRIRYGRVDMGAYERINEGMIFKAW